MNEKTTEFEYKMVLVEINTGDEFSSFCRKDVDCFFDTEHESEKSLIRKFKYINENVTVKIYSMLEFTEACNDQEITSLEDDWITVVKIKKNNQDKNNDPNS